MKFFILSKKKKIILSLILTLGTFSPIALADNTNNAGDYHYNEEYHNGSEVNYDLSFDSESRLNCNGLIFPPYDNSSSGCFYKNMPLHNQRVISEMHCIPTAATMALDTLITEKIDFSTYFNTTSTSNWPGVTYLPLISISDKIQAMGALMGTSTSTGTGSAGAALYPAMANYFKNASNINLSASSVKFTNTYFANRVLSGESGFLVYGHYAENCTSVGTTNTCTYTRNNGHAVVINGFYGITSTVALNIFNPYGVNTSDSKAGVEENRSIQYLINNSSVDNRPYGSNSYYLFQNGSQIKVIDSWRSIDTN